MPVVNRWRWGRRFRLSSFIEVTGQTACPTSLLRRNVPFERPMLPVINPGVGQLSGLRNMAIGAILIRHARILGFSGSALRNQQQQPKKNRKRRADNLQTGPIITGKS